MLLKAWDGAAGSKADALRLPRKEAGRRGLRGSSWPGVGNRAQSRLLQHEMGLSRSKGVRPGEGEEKAATATSAAPWSHGGREPDGRGRWVFKHRLLQGHFFENVKPNADGGFRAGPTRSPKRKSSLRNVIIRLMPPSEEVSGSPARGSTAGLEPT